jgi:acetylornithine deacetylase/succinyl-diaminopimelate desuccinylase-like protein
VTATPRTVIITESRAVSKWPPETTTTTEPLLDSTITLDSNQLAELYELLRIPSISADPERLADVRAAAEWIVDFVQGAGGQATIVQTGERPLVDAVFPASTSPSTAPHVLCYGHFDVQPPAPLELWESDPFSPEVRDGWLYARGVADDKGQLWALLRAAADLAREGALPVNVRFCCDGEEEVGGTSIVDFIEREAADADACVIFDTAMLDEQTPVFTIGTRGTVYCHVEVRTGVRDLHSGAYGGAALNALHVLVDALHNVVQRDGRLPAALLTDVVEPGDDELREWSALPDGASLLAAQGAVPTDAAAAREFYLRTWGLPSLDVNGIEGGSPVQQKTIVASAARANLSMRLVPGQTVERLFPIIEHLLRTDLPAGAELTVELVAACDPGITPHDSRALRLAAEAFERATGTTPLVLRSGGSLPIMPLLERLGIPAVVSGFDVPSGNVHAPNERMLVSHLALAVSAARELFTSLGALSSP